VAATLSACRDKVADAPPETLAAALAQSRER